MGEEIFITDQSLIENGEINIYLIKDNISENKIGTISIDIKSAKTTGATKISSNIISSDDTLTIPTKLSPEKWRELLETESAIIPNTENNTLSNNKVDIKLDETEKLQNKMFSYRARKNP